MGIDNFDPKDPRVQLLLAKQQLKFNDELSGLQKQLELKKQEILYLQEAINRSTKSTSSKKGTIRFIGLLASIIFLLSTLLIGFGTSWLASTPPSSQGWFMITLGGVAYLIGAIMTNLMIGENK